MYLEPRNLVTKDKVYLEPRNLVTKDKVYPEPRNLVTKDKVTLWIQHATLFWWIEGSLEIPIPVPLRLTQKLQFHSLHRLYYITLIAMIVMKSRSCAVIAWYVKKYI